MKLLADENIERPLILYLRQEGHDVLSVAESVPTIRDDDVLALAVSDQRVLLSNDLDFGELVYHRKLNAPGIVLLRLRAKSLAEKVKLFAENWRLAEGKVTGNFVVISNRRIRVRPL